MTIERDVAVHGVSMHYTEEGAGDPPLVLIHGLGSAGVKFRPSLPHLGRLRRAIALDLPGFGRSDAPRASYSPAWQAGAVRAFLDALSIPRAIVVGNSYGGLVAAWFAAAWPERTAAVVLVAPALPNDGPPSQGAGTFVLGAAPLTGWLAQRWYWTRDPAVIVQESLARNCADPSRVSPEVVALLEEDAARKGADPAAWRVALGAQRATLWAVTGRRETTWRVLSSIRPPLLLLWGAEDRVVPVHVAHAAVRRAPGAHLIVLDDCGHNPQMERPEEFAGAVTAFVRALEGRDPDAPTLTPPDKARERVQLVEYDVRWPLMFEQEKQALQEAIGPQVVRIEHIGSTAVPGLAAKPIVDICVTVPDIGDTQACIAALERMGYRYVPELERLLPDRRFLEKEGAFHVHLYGEGDPAVQDHLMFRDHLRADPAAARAYEQLKVQLAETRLRADYTEAKGPFISSVMAAARARLSAGRGTRPRRR